MDSLKKDGTPIEHKREVDIEPHAGQAIGTFRGGHVGREPLKPSCIK